MTSNLFQSIGYDTEEKFCLNVGAPGPKALREAAKIMKIAANHCLDEEINEKADIMQYGPPNGANVYLRELSTFLTEHYDDHVSIGDLILTSGATMGVYALLTLLFPNQKCPVFVEEVTYHIAISMIGGDLKFPLIPVPMDDNGVDPKQLEETIKKSDLKQLYQHGILGILYLVPNFQNPTGICTSEARRSEIVEIARKNGILVICDDVYDLLYYENRPPKRIFAYDNKKDPDYRGNVISNGTFAKILGPGLRLGWMEVPQWVKKIFENSGLAFSGGSLNHFTSVVVAKALHLGLVSQHLINLRNEYRVSLAVAYKKLDKTLGRICSYEKTTGGYFIWMTLPQGLLASDVLEISRNTYGVLFQEGTKFAANEETKKKFSSHVRISISYYEPEKLEKVLEDFSSAVIETLSSKGQLHA